MYVLSNYGIYVVYVIMLYDYGTLFCDIQAGLAKLTERTKAAQDELVAVQSV